MLAGAAFLAALLAPGSAFAADADRAAIRATVDKQLPESIARIQDWIKHPGIAAEKWQMDPAVEYTMGLLKDAGFQMVQKVPTSGAPGIFATLDAGAKRTVGIYMMYDVKQVNPAEWTTPPFDATLVDKPGFGKVIVGRGAVNPKGPEATFLAALHAFKAAGKKLPVNIVLVAEGEEEIASPHFHEIRSASRSARGTEKSRWHHHSVIVAGRRWQHHHRAWRQGADGVPADQQRRTLGPRAEGRCAFQPACDGRTAQAGIWCRR